MKRSYFVAASLLVFACSSEKKDGTQTSETGTKKVAQSVPAPAASTGMPPGPYTILRSKREVFSRKSAKGETHNWKLLAGIEVRDESIKQLYESRGSFFVSFKAQVKAGEENCLLRWKTDLIATATGKGESVGTIEGARALVAGETNTVSGVLALSGKDASRVQSGSAGFWTLCGADLPPQSAHDISITSASTEEIKVGNAFTIHHSVINLERPAQNLWKNLRCHFNVVAEDVDKDGYTLNRDFSSYSLGTQASGQVKLRRTSFEGGSELDFVKAVASKRTYLNEVSCQERWDSKTATAKGIRIEDLDLHRFVPAAPAKDLDRASFDYSATIANTSGKDCAFRVRLRMLDKAGFAMHKAPVLSEVFHLRKNATVRHRSDNHRLYSWLDQADEATSLVVHEAAPVRDCTTFDAKRASPKSGT